MITNNAYYKQIDKLNAIEKSTWLNFLRISEISTNEILNFQLHEHEAFSLNSSLQI